MTFDVVICTYNRPKRVNSLVKQILTCSFGPSTLIVIDSSEEENFFLKLHESVKYLTSTYKAQPYQRYVGLLASTSNYVCFLDDDLDVLNSGVFEKMLNVFKENRQVVGVTARVDYRSGLFVGKEAKSITRNLGGLKRVLQRISLNSYPAPGKISLVGNGGGYLHTDGYVCYFPGPNMAFERNVAFQLFDETLLDAYIKKIGKGEDKYLSMKANLYGKLYCLGKENYFFHPPIESSYNSGLTEFQVKQAFSRYLLINRYLNVFFKMGKFSIFVYTWYCFFRLLGSINNFRRFKGVLKGMLFVFKYRIFSWRIVPQTNFMNFAKVDSKVIDLNEFPNA